MINEAFGKYVREQREQLDISLNTFARDVMGCSPAYWSDVETGKRTITIKRISYLAWVLSQRIETVLDDEIDWLQMYHRLLKKAGMMSNELEALLKIIDIILAKKGSKKQRLDRIYSLTLEVLFMDMNFIDELQEKIMEAQKVKIPRSEEYLNWIRAKKCIVCFGSPSHAHHTETGGTGLKGSDYSAVPLCRLHHREVHDMGKVTFQEEYEIDFPLEVRYLNEEWEKLKKEEDDD